MFYFVRLFVFLLIALLISKSSYGQSDHDLNTKDFSSLDSKSEDLEKQPVYQNIHKKTPDTKSHIIFLSPGEKKRLKSPAGENIRLSRSGIITVSEEGSQIILKARKTGSLFLEKGYNTLFIQVLDRNTRQGLNQLIQHIEDTPWLDWNFSEEKLHITGAIYRFQSWKTIAKISKKYNISYITKAHISHNVRAEAQKFFSNHVSDFKVFWDFPIKAATAYTPPLLFSHYGIASEQNEDLFPKPLVKFQIMLTELSANQAKKWNFLSSVQLMETSFIQKQFLKNQGESQASAEAVLIAENKQPAEFLFGGEAPVHNYNYESKTKSISWKDYGVSITLTPHVKNDLLKNSRKSIFLDFSIKISEIDPTYSSEGSPASKTHRLSSKIHLPEEKTLCLSSLKRTQKGRSSHNPFMISLPLLNSLIHTKGGSEEKSQAVICITPEIVKTEKLFSSFRKRSKTASLRMIEFTKEFQRKAIYANYSKKV